MWDVVSVTRRSSGVAPRACVRVYARVLVPPNLYIHTYKLRRSQSGVSGRQGLGAVGTFDARNELAFTRYSFSLRPLYKNQYYYSQAPPLFGHNHSPPFTTHTIAQYSAPPPTILHCNTCHTILAMAISSKGQVTSVGPASLSARV